MSVQENLKKLGLSLPNIPTPVANYVPWKRDGNTIYLSGQGPRDKDGKHITGTVGKDVTVEQAYEYAKLVGLNLLAAANAAAVANGAVPRAMSPMASATRPTRAPRRRMAGEYGKAPRRIAGGTMPSRGAPISGNATGRRSLGSGP